MSAAFPDSSKVNGPAASRRWQAVQRAICRLAVVAAALMLGAAPVRADYNNPTSSADCNIYSNQYPFMGRKRALDQRISQCLSQARSASWVRIPACGYPADPRCAPLESQKCQLENQMRGIREMCMVKLQAFEAKARARRIAEEQAARERKRAEQEAMADRRKYRDETIRRTITPGGIDRDLKPGGNLTQALNAGRVVAGKFAGLQLSKPGALHLSAALSAESLRIAEAIQTTALERFRETMAQFAKDNPSFEANFGKPTPGRLQALDAQLNQLRALEGQVKHAAAALQHGLPVGGESAVIGEDAERLTQIAQAMADGTLKTPLFDTPASAAVTEIERHRAIERRRAERREKDPDIFKDASKGLSGGRRFYRGALAHVIKENTRKRQEALRKQLQPPRSNHNDALAFVIKKPSCVHVSDHGQSYRFVSRCRKIITVQYFGSNCRSRKVFFESYNPPRPASYDTVRKPCRISITQDP
jgi:hypothetical protein